MTTLALGAPTVKLPGLTAPLALLAAAETAMAANTAFSFTNVPAGLVIVHFVVGAAGAGNLNFNAVGAVAVANSSQYLFGPFDPAIYSDVTGTVTCTVSVATGNSVGVYIWPGTTGTRALHNPLEMTAGATDS